ncbi:MAG: hypothetical protein FWE85_00265 [Clostridiales bacterium]|nr:hypothetical protein [Clostridiales bacterium]
MDEPNYEMRYPKWVFWIGVVGAALFALLAALPFVTGEGTGTAEIVIAALLLPFALLGVYLALHAAKWKIIVEGDNLTIHMPFCPALAIKFRDITVVAVKLNGIIGYVGGKRIFAADVFTSNYGLFAAQLHEAGKMETTQKKNSFTVRPNKANLMVAVLGVLFFGGMLVWFIFWPNAFETESRFVQLFSYFGFPGLFLASLYYLAHSLFWKITVTRDMLIVRNAFRVEKAYPIGEISKVEEKGENFVLYAGTEKIAKIQVSHDGLSILLERLAAENVTLDVDEQWL